MIRNGVKQAPFFTGLHVTYVMATMLGIKDKAFLSSRILTPLSCKAFIKVFIVLNINMTALSRACKPSIVRA